MQFYSQDIEQYCKKYSMGNTELLSDLSSNTWETEEMPQMISGSLIGGLLQLLIKISNKNNE